MVGLLSMGSDPTAAIQALAKSKKLECREVSMGQGQEVHARKLITTFQQNGGWALLQNCHLALDFMQEALETLKAAENVDENFRLWITTEEHPKFPINLLQSAIKFTNEPPQGIKANLKGTYTDISQDQLDISAQAEWKPMLYGVAFLHAIVQERRKFGPLGWNIPYEFNQGDLLASVQFVQNHLDDIDPKKGVAWPTVRYMLSEVHYGGRVTDDRDKRLLITYCTEWFKDLMFKPEFKYFGNYNIPVHSKISEYFETIEEMSPFDGPEVFGLHPNADITYMTTTAQGVLSTIVDIQPKESSGGGGETREDVVIRLCNEFLEKLPDDFVPHEVKAKLRKTATNPMTIFLRQEIGRIQRVLSLVRTTLKDLLLAIDGTIIMSEALRDALDNMYDARVPNAWADISWTSGTLGFWFTELIDRHVQFHSWCFHGRPNAYWLTGFFNPQGFITAMRQEITRAHKGWALDSVVCCNEITKLAGKEDVKDPPKEGVYIYGLFLDGAGWDKRNSQLQDPPPKVLYTTLPVLHLSAINSTADRNPKLYECPIYRKPRRTDLEFVVMVDLKAPADKGPTFWIMRGVALLCDTK
jgi:dynein heavy chain